MRDRRREWGGSITGPPEMPTCEEVTAITGRLTTCGAPGVATTLDGVTRCANHLPPESRRIGDRRATQQAILVFHDGQMTCGLCAWTVSAHTTMGVVGRHFLDHHAVDQ